MSDHYYQERIMSGRCRETVDMIRAALPGVQDADVYVSQGGDALIFTDGALIHVSEHGGTSETRSEFTTGWET